MLNLDTHIVIDLYSGELDPRLHAPLKKNELATSSIVLWELAKLWDLKRINLNPSESAFKRALQSLILLPINLEIAIQSTRLDFKSDPADELIAATSIVSGCPLVTRDAKIRKSKMTPLLNW